MAYKAKLRKKSVHTGDICENHKCYRQATEEAVYGSAVVRCCNKNACEMYALKEAVDREALIMDLDSYPQIPFYYFSNI